MQDERCALAGPTSKDVKLSLTRARTWLTGLLVSDQV